ncbi:MAG: 50S ribosomal protein L18 [Patescibacteria group bacterium]|nr:50S ribosomal protein L18 [Patescibacteria group bacterium]
MSKLTPKTKNDLRKRRHARIRARVSGSQERPRLAIFRSNKFVYAQIIDDERGVTLASASSKDIEGKTMSEDAKMVGERIAKAALERGVKKVVFDRGGFTYSARVRALAEAARAAGLEF